MIGVVNEWVHAVFEALGIIAFVALVVLAAMSFVEHIDEGNGDEENSENNVCVSTFKAGDFLVVINEDGSREDIRLSNITYMYRDKEGMLIEADGCTYTWAFPKKAEGEISG